jgi:hypothetical protein
MGLSPDLTFALAACQSVNTDSEEFCYSWIADSYKTAGVAPWHLKALVKQGYLTRVDGSRGGHRAYYRINSALAAIGS